MRSGAGEKSGGRAPALWKLKLEFSKAISAAVSTQQADAKALREEIDGRNVEILATIDRADSDVRVSMEADQSLPGLRLSISQIGF